MTNETSTRMQISVTFVPSPKPQGLSTSTPRTRHSPLRAAYFGTEYWFDDGELGPMQIGVRHPGVAQLLKEHGVSGAAFLTAWNPCSDPIGALHNHLANNALLADLESGAFDCKGPIFDGLGNDREMEWPPEASFMALGIPLEEATALGQRYGQNAFVWIDATGLPSLVELVDLDAPIPTVEERLAWVLLSTTGLDDTLGLHLGMHHWRKLNRGEVTSYTTTAGVTWEFLLETREIHVHKNRDGRIETLQRGPLDEFGFKVGKVF